MGLCKKNLGDKGYPSTSYKTVLYDVAETSSSLNYPVPRFFICSAEQLCPFSLSYFHSSSRRIADCCKGNSPLRLFLRSVPVERTLAGISWYYEHFCNLAEFTELQQGVLLFIRLAGNTNLHNTFVVLARVPCGGQAHGAII
jgi:hypothetical protein